MLKVIKDKCKYCRSSRSNIKYIICISCKLYTCEKCFEVLLKKRLKSVYHCRKCDNECDLLEII